MKDELKPSQHPEFHKNFSYSRLNWLRAAVLGANDGIVSIAGLVVGVASATDNERVILTAGLAGILAGALSMAAGEYVSVSSQRDSEKAALKMEEYELKHFPKEELEELAKIYETKGLSGSTAKKVAQELTEKDALKAHLEAELGMSQEDLTNPWAAAFASAVSFVVGSILPITFILLSPSDIRIQATFVAVLVSLALTGYLSAKVGNSKTSHAVVRVVVGGFFAMLLTYIVGRIFSISGV